MKKGMLALLGAILLVELIIYFVVVSPQGGEFRKEADGLNKTLKSLNGYVKKGRDIPSPQRVNIYRQNKGKLVDQRKECLAALRDIDSKGLKKWFPELNVRTWEIPPAAAEFQPYYKDRFNALRKKCEESKIEITNKETLTPSKEESDLIRAYQRSASRSLEPGETKRANKTGGLWETNELNNQNLHIAQKQYWIQEAIVNALAEAKATHLVYISFHRPRQAAKEPENVVAKYFKRIPVKVLARMHYGAIPKMLESLIHSSINMDFKGLQVIKPLLTKIATNPDPSITRGGILDGSQTNGVFPKVLDGVDFGIKPDKMKDQLLGQDKLISEPPVLVEFSYDVMEMKEESARRPK